MMFIPEGRTIHFHLLGICGTAMASCAAMLKDSGHKVTGSDNNAYPPMSDFLRERGIEISGGYSPENVIPKPDIVVVGNSVSRGNPELEEVLSKKLFYTSMPEVIREFLIRGKRSIVVAGTHGKTTTSSLTAWALEKAGLSPGFLIGGMPLNFSMGCRRGTGKYFVIEGDEYDTAYFDKRAKFFHYLPDVLIINNIEFDHADIYRSLDEILLSFRRLINIVPGNGTIIINSDDKNAASLIPFASERSKTITCGFSGDPDYRISETEYSPSQTFFRFSGRGIDHTFSIPLLGRHNVKNAAICAAVCLEEGSGSGLLDEAFKEYIGIKKRMELKGIEAGIRVYDDFAHHPTAVNTTLEGIRPFTEGKLWAVFEPRSNSSRRNIHKAAFASSFESADKVIIQEVSDYKNIPEEERFDPHAAAEEIRHNNRDACTAAGPEDIAKIVSSGASEGDVVVCMSNGDFGNVHNLILESLRQSSKG
ncbi:MAG: UDP-N-acetylmuramate:L-alanyl-gamma-D-glutamyl-meso-diaminopimelate ligase [Fibrobacterota bacterium]